MTLKEAAQLALDVQNAVNMQAVLNAWASVQPTLNQVDREGAPVAGWIGGTTRRHPVNVLFMSKLAAMMVVTTDCLGGVYQGGVVDNYDMDLFREAYAECQRLATDPEGAVVEGVAS